MQFLQALFTIVSLVAISQAAAIPPSASSGSDSDSDGGLLGGMCDQISERFYNFGQCISNTPQFHSLNSTFWYQAARHELCGYPFSYQQAPANATSVASNGKSNSATDIQLELQAEYIYLMQTSGESTNATITAIDSSSDSEYKTFEKRDGSFGLPQCLNACDILQKYSNYVQPCWEVTGLTVLYGVCEVGCRYYF